MRQTSKNVSPFSNEVRNAYVIEHITDALLKVKRIFSEDILIKYSRNGQTRQTKKKTDR